MLAQFSPSTLIEIIKEPVPASFQDNQSVINSLATQILGGLQAKAPVPSLISLLQSQSEYEDEVIETLGNSLFTLLSKTPSSLFRSRLKARKRM